MSDINSLTQLNIPYILVGMLVIIVCIVYLIDVFGKLIKHIRKPVGWVSRNDADHETLLKLKDELAELREHSVQCIANVQNKDKEIEDKLDKLTNMFVDKQIDDYRWEIINAADKITNGRNLSRDAYQHCFNTYERYETILKDFGRTNHEVDLSIDIIRKSYQDKLVKGFNYRVTYPNDETKEKTPEKSDI